MYIRLFLQFLTAVLGNWRKIFKLIGCREDMQIH